MIKKLMNYTERRTLLLSTVLALVGVGCHLLAYFGAAQIIIGLANRQKLLNAYMHPLAITTVGVLGKTVFHNMSTYYAHKGAFRVLSNLRHSIVDKLPKLSMGFFEKNPSGEIKNIFVERINGLEPILAHMIPEMTANLIGPITIVIWLFFLDFRLALAAILTLPIGIFLLMRAMKGYEENFMKVYEAERQMNTIAVEYINGIKVIKAFGQSKNVYNRFTHAANAYVTLTLAWMKSVQIYLTAMFAIMPAVLVGVLPMGIFLYINGSIALPRLLTIFLLSLGIAQPILSAIGYTDDLAKVGATMGEIFGILDAEEMVRPDNAPSVSAYHVDFKNVHFKYDKDYVLQNVNLSIPAARTTAIVGASGSGKSTLGKLLLSFWDIEEGEVAIGGVNIKDMSFDQSMAQIAYVAQDNYLFNDSVMNNIRFGKPSARDEEIIAICKQSGCHDFIESLEFGYETVVGGKGSRLSGGERQRLTIARAMLKDAPIVLLDEATAYIDPESESTIQQALSKLVKDKTLIVIAHRLSTVTNANKIVVMDKGQIVDTGDHGSLMRTSALYQNMYNLYGGQTISGGIAND